MGQVSISKVDGIVILQTNFHNLPSNIDVTPPNEEQQ
jgi:hypothetical protein